MLLKKYRAPPKGEGRRPWIFVGADQVPPEMKKQIHGERREGGGGIMEQEGSGHRAGVGPQ